MLPHGTPLTVTVQPALAIMPTTVGTELACVAVIVMDEGLTVSLIDVYAFG